MNSNFHKSIFCFLVFINCYQTVLAQKSMLYFPNVLIYELERNGEKQEFWIYHNPKTKQLLYTPNDDMISAVVVYPSGKCTIYGTNEGGEKIVQIQHFLLPETTKKTDENRLKPLEKNIEVQSEQQTILSKGYSLSYLKSSEIDTVFVTTQIVGNAQLLYGLGRIEGDAKLPFEFDCSAFLSSNQWLTHYFSKYVWNHQINFL